MTARTAEVYGATAPDEVDGAQRLELDMRGGVCGLLEEPVGNLAAQVTARHRQAGHLIQRPSGSGRLVILTALAKCVLLLLVHGCNRAW